MSGGVLLVAVNYRSAPDVERLIESLRRGTSPEWRLVVVDNSESEAQSMLLARICGGDERASVIVAPANLGYFGGARYALSVPSSLTAAWTVVTNVDVRMSSSFVEALIALPDEGVIAPVIMSAVSGHDQNPHLRSRPGRWRARVWQLQMATTWSARLSIALWHAAKRARHRMRRDPGRDRGPGPFQIYAPHGSCVAFSRSYFQRGGTLDHEAFLFAEEITVGERCRLLGVRVMHEPSVMVFHEEHRSTGWWRSRRMIEWQRESVKVASGLLLADRKLMPERGWLVSRIASLHRKRVNQ
ncbi:MAG: glycosyltransferase [Nocardioides sp.]|uniref:glycosyltransferase family 2 protein n=1 Tax=Nocardioides sp. TaxID=35761 RepID=UPI000C962ADF|nr:glycosyltransferase [Nocardioides sp.]MAS56094.1 hypothetical protein [Pimelobacter sp.]MDE0775062.1 glycosyltransferase [Nocardioides sp.]